MNRVGERRLGDALLDRRVHDLREWPHRGRPFEQCLEGQDGEWVDLDIVQHCRA